MHDHNAFSFDTITHNKIERIYKGVISADVKNNFSFDLIALYKQITNIYAWQYNKLLVF